MFQGNRFLREAAMAGQLDAVPLLKVVGALYRGGVKSYEVALHDIHTALKVEPPYDFARRYGALVNDSAEEFMVEFMTEFNRVHGIHY